jgi:hypothetical protein
VDPFGSFTSAHGLACRVLGTADGYSVPSVLAGRRSSCTGRLILNKLSGWYQDGGGWFNDRTRFASAAFDYELST